MCGRFAQFFEARELRDFFGTDGAPDLPFRYNIAPAQKVTGVTAHNGRRQALAMHWGLKLPWAEKGGYSLINTRAESFDEKKTFHRQLEHTRCVIPVNGFYEWQEGADGKVPYFIRPADAPFFALAGIYQPYADETGAEQLSCSIITTMPNAVMERIHNRMPVILTGEALNLWLSGESGHEALQAVLRPCEPELIRAYAVSRTVNNAHHEGPDCVEPYEN